MRVIISGGGSGGHVYPAIAIANELKRRIENLDILFVGALGKIEMEKVPAAGYSIIGLWISGMHRGQWWRNLTLPFKLVSSLWKSRRILKQHRPDVVVGVGGYASGPLLKMAQREKIPTLIQEQNSYPGKTNLLLANQVNHICVAYPGMERFFPKEKITITGNPVRRDLVEIGDKKAEALTHFGLDPDKKTLFVFGGSLGARTFNEMMIHNDDFIKSLDDLQIIWQVGKLYWDQYSASTMAQYAHVKALAFVDRMDLGFAVADLILCRAGASTISELSLAQKAAILVPSPNVAEDHQTANAKALLESEAAILGNDKTIGKEFKSLIENNINDTNKLVQLRENIVSFGRPNAASDIVDIIIKLVKK